MTGDDFRTLRWAVGSTNDAFAQRYPAEHLDLEAVRVLVEHAEKSFDDEAAEKADARKHWAVYKVVCGFDTQNRWTAEWAQTWTGATEAAAEEYRRYIIADSESWRAVPLDTRTVLVRPIGLKDLPAVPSGWSERARQAWRNREWEKLPATSD